MIKYIVLWVLTSYQAGSCPDAVKKNAFGESSSPYMSCAVLHIESREDTLQKGFNGKKEALAFIDSLYSFKRTQHEGFPGLGTSKITLIKLDSLK